MNGAFGDDTGTTGAGMGGSGGTPTTNSTLNEAAGLYGGGGSGGQTAFVAGRCAGANGAVKIVWGTGLCYPDITIPSTSNY